MHVSHLFPINSPFPAPKQNLNFLRHKNRITCMLNIRITATSIIFMGPSGYSTRWSKLHRWVAMWVMSISVNHKLILKSYQKAPDMLCGDVRYNFLSKFDILKILWTCMHSVSRLSIEIGSVLKYPEVIRLKNSFLFFYPFFIIFIF